MIRTRHFALQWGYSFAFDMNVGFTLCLLAKKKFNDWHRDDGTVVHNGPRYKLIIEVGWNWKPTIVYRDPHWYIDEPNMVRSWPIRRSRPLRRRWIRRIYWDRAARYEWMADDEKQRQQVA